MVTASKSVPLSDCCVQDGYVTLKCGCELPVMTAACIKIERSGMPVTNGIVNGTVARVLRDSGCSSVVIRRSLVPDEQLTGEEKSCVLVDGTIRIAPVAQVKLDTPCYVGWAYALCMTDPIYDVILGNIDNVRSPNDPDVNWQVRKIPEILTTDQSYEDMKINAAVITRTQKFAPGKPLRKVPDSIPKVSKQEIVKEQVDDPSLSRVRELALSNDEKCHYYGS